MRQEIDAAKALLLAQGFADQSQVSGAFEKFYASLYPFAKGKKQEQDRQMAERMAKEVAKGPIMFNPIDVKSVFRPTTPIDSMPKNIADILRKNPKTRSLK